MRICGPSTWRVLDRLVAGLERPATRLTETGAALSASTLSVVPSPLDVIAYMRTVGRGSPVDRPWSVAGQIVTSLRLGRGQEGSPLTLYDVIASADYRSLMTAKVAEGDPAPGFELPRHDGGGAVRLASLLDERPVALVFGSYT